MYAEVLAGQDYSWADITKEEKLGLNQDSSSPYRDHVVTHFWAMPDERTVDTIELLSYSRTLLKYNREFPKVGSAFRSPSPVVFFRVRGDIEGIAFARHPEADLGIYCNAFNMLVVETNKHLLSVGYPSLTEPPIAEQARENLAILV